MERYSSRKFALLVGCIILFSVLLIVKILTVDAYQSLLMVLLPSYFAANVWEKKNE